MKTYVEIKFKLAGYHQWENAPRRVAFLSYKHRHTFHFKCVKEADSLDREVEIIQFKNDIIGHLKLHFDEYLDGLDFGGMSCEMIAQHLVAEFNLSECQVLEDGENGAIVINK